MRQPVVDFCTFEKVRDQKKFDCDESTTFWKSYSSEKDNLQKKRFAMRVSLKGEKHFLEITEKLLTDVFWGSCPTKKVFWEECFVGKQDFRLCVFDVNEF